MTDRLVDELKALMAAACATDAQSRADEQVSNFIVLTLRDMQVDEPLIRRAEARIRRTPRIGLRSRR